MIILTCVFLSAISLASLECVVDSSTAHLSAEANLSHDLMNKYVNSKLVTRMKNSSVNVTIKFLLKAFQFYNEEEEFAASSWVFLSWHDECLKWNPADYDNIENTLVSIRHIWSPQITMDNEAYEFDVFYSPFAKCQVFHYGNVACIPKITNIVPCKSVLIDWPYDIQTCTLNYTAKYDVKLSYLGKPITTLGAEYGTGWTIVAYEYTRLEDLNATLSITLSAERTAILLAATCVLPLVVIAVLCVTALFVDVRRALRVYILWFCLASDFVFGQTINETIPKRGHGTPKILIFLRNSILMSAVAMVVTYTLKSLRKRVSPAPGWVVRVNDFCLKDSRKKIIWPKWEAEFNEGDKINEALEVWNSLSYVLNFFVIVIYIATYFILYLVSIPRPTPVTI